MVQSNLLASDVELSPYYRCHTWRSILQCLSSDHSTKISPSSPYTSWYSRDEWNTENHELPARPTSLDRDLLVHKYAYRTTWFLAHLHEIMLPFLLARL